MDPLGRLLHQRWQGLPGHASAPQSAAPLIGGLQQRRYTYDSLGQLIGIQTPTEANAYQYDKRQRLIGQTHASAQGEHQHRWRLDPAGNRLPAKAAFQHLGAKTAASADWSAQVQQNLHDPQCNLLQPDQNPDTPAGQNIERWRDNRIGWSQDADNQDATHYRYDCWGNRTQALHIDGSITELHYDSLHQLRQAVQRNPQGQELSRTTYRYDAFGRRVSKTYRKTGELGHITHFGWDGDRLVHTETAGQIHHTVYEPGSFVPLLQVQRSKENVGQTDPVKTLLGLRGNSDASNALERELPREERELLHQALKEALQPGYQLSGLLPQELQAHVRESIQALKDAQAQTQEEHPLTIRHVLTDHLGTPIALVNANGEQLGQVAWVARYTAWGEIADEYNPDQIHQPIRFQGQQFDEETNLHYNRFRYYDPSVGQYITQDPIGLAGGINSANYRVGPVNFVDPMGLDPIAVPSKGLDVGKTKGIMDKISDVLNWDENKETGRQIKIKQDLLMCKAEKEVEDKVNNEELTPQAARGALAAKRISIYADGPVSAGVEATQAGVIENAAKSYGYATAPAKDCAKLLNPQSGQSQFDFFKK